MKKLISVIIAALGLAAAFAFSAFAAETGAGADEGFFTALTHTVQGYAEVMYANFKEVLDPIYQAIVWVFDQVWHLLEDLIGDLLS